MKIQVLPAILPHPLVCIKMQLPLQAQQRTNNFGYKNRLSSKELGISVSVCRIGFLAVAWNFAWLSAPL